MRSLFWRPLTYCEIIVQMYLTDLTLDMSAVSLSSHVGERGVSVGGAGVAAGVGGDDIRQPSVDGLHSPSSPNAPVAVVKQGMHTIIYVWCACMYISIPFMLQIIVPSYCQITILLVVHLSSSLAYFMMTQPLPIAGKLPIITLVAR